MNIKKSVIKETVGGYMFALPVILGLAIFTLYPVIQSFIISFYNYNGLNTVEFIGLKNFQKILFSDPETWKVVSNTLIYTLITVPLSLILGYLVALLVNSKVKGVSLFRVIYYLPVIIPSVAAGILWRDMFDPHYGIINQLLSNFNIPPSMFFNSAKTALPTLILTTLWNVGGGMIIWLAAFKNIPDTLYEAAKIDGATKFKQFTAITIPMSTPMIFYNLVLGVIGAIQIFSTFVIAGSTYGRGPEDSLYFIAVKIYNEAFGNGSYRLGYASALGWLLFVFIGALTAVMFKTNKWIVYGEE